jgi:transposase
VKVERAPAREVHIILDNLSAHKSQVVRDFLATHLNVHFPFTPTYSSWLNQVEIWFSKVERDVIARGIFTSVKDLARKLRRHINAYSANAKPIQWRYSDPTRRIRSNVVSATCHWSGNRERRFLQSKDCRAQRFRGTAEDRRGVSAHGSVKHVSLIGAPSVS